LAIVLVTGIKLFFSELLANVVFAFTLPHVIASSTKTVRIEIIFIVVDF
jgi:hypothetical protein